MSLLTTKVYGDKEAAAKLKKIQKATQRAALAAGRKAAAVVAKEMKKRAPRRKGETTEQRKAREIKPLRQRIKVVKPKRLRKGEVAAWLAKSTAPHSHLVELGTKQRRRKSGAATGAIVGVPFAKPAASASAERAADAFREEFGKQLEKAGQKLFQEPTQG